MDRRGFLKGLGIGGALIVAAPQIVLAATTKVALPERKVFLPPADGWLAVDPGGKDETVVTFSRRIYGTDTMYVDSYDSVGSSYLAQEWTAEIVRYLDPSAVLEEVGSERKGEGWSGWLTDRTIDYRIDDAVTVRDRWKGVGVPPAEVRDQWLKGAYVARGTISVHRPPYLLRYLS